jgi:ATP-dependent helicase HrpB
VVDSQESIHHGRSYYRNLIKTKVNNSSFDPCDTGLLLSFAYPERIASAKPGNNAQFMLANGKMAMFSHSDELANEKWICVANMDMRDTMGKIFLAAPLRPIDLQSRVKEIQQVFWDNRKGELVAIKNFKIGGLIIQSKPILNPDRTLVKKAICDLIKKDTDQVLNFDDQTNQFFNRLASFKLWNPEVNLKAGIQASLEYFRTKLSEKS